MIFQSHLSLFLSATPGMVGAHKQNFFDLLRYVTRNRFFWNLKILKVENDFFLHISSRLKSITPDTENTLTEVLTPKTALF